MLIFPGPDNLINSRPVSGKDEATLLLRFKELTVGHRGLTYMCICFGKKKSG